MRHRLEYLIVRMVALCVQALPRRASLAVGSLLGHGFWALHRKRRQLALDNLLAAFPSRTERECRAIVRATFRHFGRHVVDLLNFDAMSTNEMMRLVELEGEERVEQAKARGKGVMYYSGHFGYWELQIMMHAVRFQPIAIVARTLDNPFLERFIERIRTRVRTRVVPRQGAVRSLLRALLDRDSVGMMIDQHIQDRSAILINFFDRPAATTSVIAALALRTGAPVIPVFALPLSDGRYRMIYETPVEPPDADDPDPVRTYTQRCTDVLEMYVRRYPELWLWMHRRWRAQEAEPAHDVARDPGPVDESVSQRDARRS